MKAKIKVSVLKEALAATVKIMPQKATIPVLESLQFEMIKITDSDYSTLHITGSNLEETLIYKVELEALESNVTFLINEPNKLLSLINMHDKESILHFDIKTKEGDDTSGMLNLKLNKDKLKLPITFDDDFPVNPILEEQDVSEIKINSYKQFKEDLIKLKIFADNDELRPVMNGVFFDSNVLVATNSHYMLKKTTDYSNNESQLIFNKSFISSLPDFKADKEITIKHTDKMIHIDFGYIEIFSRLIDGSYPSYGSVIRDSSPAKLTVGLDLIKDTIKKATLFSNQATSLIKLSCGASTIDVISEDVNFQRGFDGKIEHNGFENYEVLTSKLDDGTYIPFNIGIKGEFLMTVLNNIIKKDEITFEFQDQSTSIIIEDETELYLIMPMMLN